VLVLECKYPEKASNVGYVSSGVAQAFFYATQMKRACSRLAAYAVGPASLVHDLAGEVVEGVSVGIGSELHVPELVAARVGSREFPVLAPAAQRSAPIVI